MSHASNGALCMLSTWVYLATWTAAAWFLGNVLNIIILYFESTDYSDYICMYCWLGAPWPIGTVTHLFFSRWCNHRCWSSQQSVLTSITRVHQDYVGRAVALLGKSWLPNMYGQCLQGFCGLHQNQQNGSIPATFHYQNGSLAKIDCSTVCSSFWGLCGSVSKAK